MSSLTAGKALAMIATVVMAGAVAGGLYVLGPPAHQRQLRLDSYRVSALNMLSIAIHAYWVQHRSLPASLDDLAMQDRWIKDPVTAQLYVYKTLDAATYSLCATFATDNRAHRTGDVLPSPYGPIQGWQHPAGKHCFRFLAESQQGSHK